MDRNPETDTVTFVQGLAATLPEHLGTHCKKGEVGGVLSNHRFKV